jgi:hypothetical protein
MSGGISFEDLHKLVLNTVSRVEALEKSVQEIKKPPEITYRFPPEEASLIAKEFSGVLRALSDAFASLSEKGIAYESKFDAKNGILTVQLFKYVEAQGGQKVT